MFSKIGALSIAALLLTGATGCSSTPADSSPTQQETVDNTPRAEKGAYNTFDRKLTVKDENKFSENNYLATSDKEKFSITSYGHLETAAFELNGESLKPADGEVFHTINYSSTSTTGKASFDVNGTTTVFKDALPISGTLVISAPENATILLNIEDNDLTQSIDIKTAKRTTQGLADVWYKKTVGKVTDGIVSTSAVLQGKTIKLDYSISDATRTAYSNENKWADGGKSSWVILSGTDVEWGVPSNGSPANKDTKFTLVDEKGTEYVAESEGPETYSSNMKLEFKVPATADSFTLKSVNNADVSYWGEIVGKVPTISNDQVKISFK
jgi:hypothetical protein